MRYRPRHRCIDSLALLLLAWFTTAPVALAIDPNPPGRLALHVAISDSPDFVTEWVRTSPSHDVSIHRVREIRRGRTLYIAFIVTGYQVSASEAPDLEIDATVRRPDGSVMSDDRPYARVQYRAGERGFVMGDPAMDLVFDDDDPVGIWKIEAVVRDRLAHTRAVTAASLTLNE